jgi:hypothetical protein
VNVDVETGHQARPCRFNSREPRGMTSSEFQTAVQRRTRSRFEEQFVMEGKLEDWSKALCYGTSTITDVDLAVRRAPHPEHHVIARTDAEHRLRQRPKAAR